MLRLILGVVVGMLAGGLTVGLVEMAGHAVFPPPAGADASTPQGMARLMASLPIGALIAVLVAWGLGVFVGSAVALRIGRRALAGWIVAGALAAGAVGSMIAIPHPLWFMLASAVVTAAAALAAQRWPGPGATSRAGVTRLAA